MGALRADSSASSSMLAQARRERNALLPHAPSSDLGSYKTSSHPTPTSSKSISRNQRNKRLYWICSHSCPDALRLRPLASLPQRSAPNAVQRHQHHRLEEALGWDAWATSLCVHRREDLFQFTERLVCQSFHLAKRMVFRDHRLRAERCQHRMLIVLSASHPPIRSNPASTCKHGTPSAMREQPDLRVESARTMLASPGPSPREPPTTLTTPRKALFQHSAR